MEKVKVKAHKRFFAGRNFVTVANSKISNAQKRDWYKKQLEKSLKKKDALAIKYYSKGYNIFRNMAIIDKVRGKKAA